MSKALGYLKQIKGTTWGSIILFILMAILAKGFTSAYSISTILKNTSILVVAAFGMTMAIILGKVDISIGSNMSFSAVIAAVCMSAGMPLWASALVAIAAGSLIGLFNGICIAIFEFNYWLTTFATLGLAKGVALGITNGATIANLSPSFKAFGSGTFLGVYYISWVALAVCVVVWYATRKTKFGYNLYSVGNSASVSAISGINVKKVVLQTYIFSGALAAIAGLLLASKSNAANPTIGDTYAFDSIAACIIGGTPFAGGKGGMEGTILGAFLLTALSHGLGLLGYTSLYQLVIIGVFIMIVIIADVMRENRKDREEKRRVFND